jgi:hypothetical protein
MAGTRPAVGRDLELVFGTGAGSDAIFSREFPARQGKY